MAYQPKSYRKFLATAVTAALVTTVAAPVVTTVSADSNTSFPDVASSHWASDAIAYLVDKGALEGRPDGKFDPNANVTRAEAAKILAITLGLEVDDSAKTEFTDAKDHWASKYIAAIQGQTEDVINGFPNGTFRPNANITRQDLAKMIVTAYELEANEDANVNFTDNTGYGAEFVKTLASLGIVEGMSEGKFVPQNNVTRAQIPVFVHRSEVESVRVTPNVPAEFAITNVTALDDTNRFLQIDFNKRVNSLETADITIQNAKSLERYGVKEVTLASNGMTATVELFSHESVKNVLEYLTDYTVTVYANGKTLEYTFNRPAFIENYVVDINSVDRKITIVENESGSTRTLEVPTDIKDFDFQTVLGEEVSVWYNDKNRVVDFKIADKKAKYDSIEITKADEIKLLTEDKKYDTSDNKFNNAANSEKFAFYVNGAKAKTSDYIGTKFNYAKVGYDDSGDVIFVSAYNLDQFLVVDRVDGNEVVGLEGTGTGGAFNAKDATVTKDGKVIALADLEKGDVLFYNTSLSGKDKFAEVYSNTVTGKIDTVFKEAVRIDGKTIDFAYDTLKFGVGYEKAVYVKKDGKTATVTSKAAEELQAAGNVSVYFDRAGNAVYITGDLANVASNTKTSIFTADIKVDSNFGKELAQIEFVTEEGKEELHQITLEDLDTISVDGVEFDIENTNPASDEWTVTLEDRIVESPTDLTVKTHIVLKNPSATNVSERDIEIPLASEGKLVNVLKNDAGKITDLEFFNSTGNKGGFGSSSATLEPGDTYVGGKRLLSSTIVFDATDGYNAGVLNDIKAKDVKVTTWGEYKGSDIKESHFIYDENNEVEALVIKQTTTADKVFEEAVITNVLRDKDSKIVEISAYVNGKEETFQVDKISNIPTLDSGHPAVLEFSKNNKSLVKAIIASGDTSADKDEFNDRIITGVNVGQNDVSIGNSEVTVGATKYRLVSDGKVINASDKNKIETKNLSDLRGKNNVTIVLDETTAGTTFVKYFIYGVAAPADTTAPTATVTTASVDVGTDVTTAQSNELGTAYLVASSAVAGLDTKTKLDAAVTAGTAQKAAVTAINTNTAIATTGLPQGTYNVVTVDAAGNVSAKSTGEITLTGDTTAPTATVASTGATQLVMTFSEPISVLSNPVADGNNIASAFTVSDVSSGGSSVISLTSAIYNASNNSVTLTIAGAETTDTIVAKTSTIEDAAGNPYTPEVITFGGTIWAK